MWWPQQKLRSHIYSYAIYTDPLLRIISTSQISLHAARIVPVRYNLKVSHHRHFHNTESLTSNFRPVSKEDISYQISDFRYLSTPHLKQNTGPNFEPKSCSNFALKITKKSSYFPGINHRAILLCPTLAD